MIETKAKQARVASIRMAALTLEQKNQALSEISRALEQDKEQIFTANRADLEQARQETISPVLIRRLKFDEGKLQAVKDGIDSLIKLPDPVGETLSCTELDDGLELYKISCPIGVLGIIFESRPDALVQISTLALKSGNAALLKGGSEASRTNQALAQIMIQAGQKAGLPAGWIQLLETRDDVKAMLAQDDSIDLIIPRGSNAFVKYIMDNTRIAVLGHADGICHVYVDKAADLEMAVRVAVDSKCQYPAVCNAMETLLVDASIANRFLPHMKTELDKQDVRLRGDEKTCRIITCEPAEDSDWQTEYNDLILAVKVVNGLDEAIEHINTYGSHHTDAIVTDDEQAAKTFMELVDSANVFWNCSTRFSDGFRYGLGAEVGISTNKIHARGPVGLEGLVIYKWKLIGHGQTVADYSGAEARSFIHRKMDKKL
ncbi:MAG: glutamate-5-semialdehyde dehydrogenase [Sedimentisphaerales bacterium]|nr:glutamate-5-semialdehyde dehydrogenase [Sedimentisphaerales bacterium]